MDNNSFSHFFMKNTSHNSICFPYILTRKMGLIQPSMQMVYLVSTAHQIDLSVMIVSLSLTCL
jgi:hypothetical protein